MNSRRFIHPSPSLIPPAIFSETVSPLLQISCGKYGNNLFSSLPFYYYFVPSLRPPSPTPPLPSLCLHATPHPNILLHRVPLPLSPSVPVWFPSISIVLALLSAPSSSSLGIRPAFPSLLPLLLRRLSPRMHLCLHPRCKPSSSVELPVGFRLAWRHYFVALLESARDGRLPPNQK